MDEQHLSDVSFSNLDLPEELRHSVRDAGFEHCTPIQAKTLPLALAGRDVAGQAQTGTGKTAAFLLATFNRLLRTPPPKHGVRQPRALILAPTRELAIQIHKDAAILSKYSDLKLGLVYGGTGYDTQREQLQAGLDVVIGTPGRIIDFMKQRLLDLSAAEVVVLDEADRMFDLGFIRDVRYILRRTPKPEERLSMLFSATLSYRVTELAYEHMNNPEVIRVAEEEKVTAEKVREIVYYTSTEEKIPLLLGLLQHMDPSRTMVFLNTKRAAERVGAYLIGNGYKAAVLSGDVPQNRRQRFLSEFTAGELQLLVATDVAARGLHIPDVSHVFNFDLPQDAEDYVHRIGRTARAGASGDAISFACEEYAFSLPSIEEYIGYKIPAGRITSDLLVEPKPPARISRPKQARGGGRSSRGPRTGTEQRQKPTRSRSGGRRRSKSR